MRPIIRCGCQSAFCQQSFGILEPRTLIRVSIGGHAEVSHSRV